MAQKISSRLEWSDIFCDLGTSFLLCLAVGVLTNLLTNIFVQSAISAVRRDFCIQTTS